MADEKDLKAQARRENAQAPQHRRPEDWPTRREFLLRLGVTVAVAGGVGYLWRKIADPTGELGKPIEPSIRLKDFSIAPAMGAKTLGIARGEKYDQMLRMATDAIGGIGHFIRKGDVVLIKPNVAFDRSPKLGATSNPEVLAALIRLVRDAGASEVRVADNPIESPESCFAKTGIAEAAQDAGAKLYLPTPSSFEMLEVPGAKLIAEPCDVLNPFQSLQGHACGLRWVSIRSYGVS